MRLLVLLPVMLLASCASVHSDEKVLSIIRGRAIIQFEQHEFFECGNTGRVLTISNPGVFRQAAIDADSDDVYYKVEGSISTPGESGSVGITDGVLVAKKVEAMTGARLACFNTMQGS